MASVEIQNVRKVFGDLETIKGVSLEVQEGSVVAVIGRSGSGKSTMLRTINGLEIFQAGLIEVDGIHIADYHANLIYNTGAGTARELRTLIQELKARVRGRFGLLLEEEVQYVGFEGAAGRKES